MRFPLIVIAARCHYSTLGGHWQMVSQYPWKLVVVLVFVVDRCKTWGPAPDNNSNKSNACGGARCSVACDAANGARCSAA